MTAQFTRQELLALNALAETGDHIEGFKTAASKLAACVDAAFEMTPTESDRWDSNGNLKAIIGLLAAVAHYAGQLEQYEPARAESLQSSIQAAKREYDSMRERLAYLEGMARAYQESDSTLRDKLQAMTGNRF